MPNYKRNGNNKWSFWLLDERIDWAVVPAGIIKGFDEELPIRLQVGTPAWGKVHIENRHSRWLASKSMCACEMLYKKLGQSGQIFSTEENGKIKIMMRIAPDALLVLRYVNTGKSEPFFTVVTLYYHNQHLDGESLGRYVYKFRTG